MGFFDSLLNKAREMADAGERYVERQADDYYRGYDSGSERASSMSDSELRSQLRHAKENGISGGMNGAGKTRAMLDEYNRRNEE